MLKKIQHYFSVLVLLVFYSLANSAALDPRYASMTCEPVKDQLKVYCDYRYSSVLDVRNVSAKINGIPVQIPQDGIAAYPAEGQTTAILIMADTSDPKRQNTVEKRYVTDLFDILSERKPGMKIGLAVFDTEVKVLAPIGSEDAEVLNSLAKIKASGQATEFYKSMLDAIAILKKVDATRKGLIILSDGKDEDRAYKADDVLKAANEAGIVILGLGYSERPADAPYLQNLQRLSEETYGRFYNLSDKKRPPELFKSPFSYIDKGGRITLSSEAFHGNQSVEFTLGLPDDKNLIIQTTVAIPDSRSFFQKFKDFLIDYWLYILLSFAGLIGLFFSIYKIIQQRAKSAPQKVEYGYLIEPDGLGTKHVINKSAIKIGRSIDNDICLTNDSISSHHAEIHRGRDGSFYIVDLASTNGVLVNQIKVTQQAITDGDVIELGEVQLKFFSNLMES